MDKSECIVALEENGIVARDQDGVVTIDVGANSEKDFKKQVDNLRDMIRQYGYTGSFGVRWKKS